MLKDWWTNIHQIIVRHNTFQISAKLSSTELQDNDFLCLQKRWIILALQTAKRILLRHWRRKIATSLWRMTTRVAQLAAYERVTDSLLDKLDYHMFTWSPFTDWLAGCKLLVAMMMLSYQCICLSMETYQCNVLCWKPMSYSMFHAVPRRLIWTLCIWPV